MSKLYKEGLIALYGEDVISAYIDDNTSEEIFEMYLNLLKSENRDNTKSLYAFENYLIKYYDTMSNPDVKRKFDDILKMVYDAVDFNNIPNVHALAESSSFLKSTLTREEYISRFASNEKAESIRKTKSVLLYYGNSISDKFEKYFNKKNSLMTNGEDYKNNAELENLKLTEEEKKLLLNFFSIYKAKNNDDRFNIIMEKYFVDLISDPYGNESSVIEKEFLVRYAISNFYILESVGMPEIGIINDNDQKGLGGVAQGQSFITVNASSNLNGTNLDIIQTACHEYEHLVQYSRSKKEAQYNDLGYYYMIYALPNNYISNNEYDTNYEYMEIELDAEKTANEKLHIYLEPLFKKYNLDVSKLNYRINKMKENVNRRRPLFNSRKQLDDKSVPNCYYNIEMLKRIVNGKPEIISEYPILKEIFNEYGTIKNIDELLFNNQKDNKIISDYIVSEIYSNKLNQIDLSSKSYEQIENFWNNISTAFAEVTNMLKDFVNNPDNLSKENATNSFVDLFNDVGRFVNVINSNFESVRNNNLTPKLFYSIKSVLKIYSDNIEKLESSLVKENINSAYYLIVKNIFEKLSSIDKKYDDYRFDTELEGRKKFIVENNLLDVNNALVENLKQGILSSNADLLNYRFKISDNEEVSVEKFLDNYAKQYLIGDEILLKDYGKVSMQQFLAYLNNQLSRTKELDSMVSSEEIQSNPQRIHR